MSLNDDFLSNDPLVVEDEEEEEEEEEEDELNKEEEEEEEAEEDEDEEVEDEEGEEDEDEGEGEGEGEEEEVEDEEDVDQEMKDSAEPKPELNDDESKLKNFYDNLLIKTKLANSFDIIPSVAIPNATGINAIALPQSSKYLFTGGDDGFIRKYDFFASIDGEVLLTTAQRHALVDTVSFAGSLSGYWENEIPVKKSAVFKESYLPQLSPVFSLQVEKNCLWLLSGLSNGGVNLQSIRHNEGTIVHHFKNHSDTVSVLKLNSAQDKFLSGSWDKLISQVDLNTGKQIKSFKDSTGQISSIEYRPIGGIDIEQIQQNSNEDESDMGSLFGDEEDATTSSNLLDPNVFLSSSIDGTLNIWDSRTNSQVIKFKPPKGTPPWCVSSCWSQDGNFIYAGRRNGTVEEFSLKMPFNSNGESKASKLLKFPQVSGPVTVVKSLPNNNHLLCASHDNIRIYDLRIYEYQKKTPFLIVPGHHGGVISDVLFDPTYRYMVSSSGNRGWQGNSTDTTFIYEVGLE